MNQPMKIAKPLPEDRPGNATKDSKTGKLTPKIKPEAKPAQVDIGHNSENANRYTDVVKCFKRILKRKEDIKELQTAEKDDFVFLREKGIPTKQARLLVQLQKLDLPDRKNFVLDFMLTDEALTQGELFGSIITDEARDLLTTQENGEEDPDAEPEEAAVSKEETTEETSEEDVDSSPAAKKK